MADDVTLRLGAEVQEAVSKLESVQKRLASIATEVKGGTPIFDAYGQVAAQATAKVDDGTGKAKKSTSELTDSVVRMTSAFTAASLIERAAGWLANMAAEAFGLGSRMLDLHDTTGLSLETLQRFEHVEKVTGTTTGTLASAAFNLGKQLAGDNGSVVAAVEELKLNYEDLQRLSPDEQFYAVAGALKEMDNEQRRNVLGGIVFKNTWKEIAPAIVGDMRKIADGAYIVGDAQLKAADDAQKAWRSFTSGTSSVLAEAAGSVVMFGRAMLIAVGAMDKPLKDATQNVRTELEQTKPKIETTAEALAKATAIVNGLTAEQRAEIETLQRMGRGREDILPKLKNNSDALALLEERQDKEREATEAATKAAEEAAKKAQERKEALDRVRLADVAVTEAVRQSILALDAKGVADRDIAIATGAHEVQIRRVIEAEKARQKEIEATVKAEADAAKAQADIAAATRKRIQDDGVARLEQAASLHQALIESERALELAQSEGLDRRLLELQYAERDEIAALHRTHDATEASTQQVEALIRARYKLERDQATAAATDIVERMRQQGVLTRTEQQQTVAALKRDYDQMVASGEYTYEQLEEAERRWREAQARLSHESLFRFVDEFQQMLGIASAAFNTIGGLGNETAAKIGAIGSRIVQTAQLGGEAMAAFATGDWVQGAIKSVQAIGTALQGLFKGNETKKAREEFADSMGLTLDGLYQKLQSMGDKGQELSNRALNVIGKHDEAGNRKWMEEVRALFESQEQAAADAAAAFTDAQERIGTALAGVTALAGAQAQTYQGLTKALDTAKREYFDLVAAGASQDRVAEAAKRVELAQAAVTGATQVSQEEFERLTRISLNTFNTLVASGVSPVEAMQRVGGSVDDLIRMVESFGLSGTEAFDTLSRWRTLTETNAPLLGQVGTLNDLMTMTATLGGLTQEAYTDMAAQGVAAYEQMRTAGFTESEALTSMAPLLESLVRLQKEKGFAVDEGTQKLIDQARAQGILSEDQLSTNDILMEGLGAVIEALGGKVPDAFRKMTTGAKESAEQIEAQMQEAARAVANKFNDLKFSVPVNFDIGELDLPEPGDLGRPAIPGFSGGSNGIRDFGARTLAFLHGREGVFTEDQIANLVANAGQLAMREAAAANLVNWASGNVGGGTAATARPSISVTNHIDATQSYFTSDALLRDLTGEISDRVVGRLLDQGLIVAPGV